MAGSARQSVPTWYEEGDVPSWVIHWTPSFLEWLGGALCTNEAARLTCDLFDRCQPHQLERNAALRVQMSTHMADGFVLVLAFLIAEFSVAI